MKTRAIQSFSLGLALAVLPFIGGCNQQPDGPKNSTSAAVQEPDALPATGFGAIPPSTTKTVPTPPAEKTLPTNIKPSPPLAEVIKLANAGLEEDVLLAYVNGSQSAFNLGSDEIIYLSDLGVPDAVVTAMIERDHFLKQPWLPPTQTTITTEAPAIVATQEEEQPVAAAPTYENPPEPYPVEEPQQVVNDDYFYDNLSPYGSWVQLDDYGWCWQPTVVIRNRSWRPYCDRGRWLYTDCGWYWQSDYSWGLTFHYGRWFNHPNRGWCWAPDRVWGPAWVTWRYNDNYCGWAPLPPRTYCRPGVGLAYYNGSVGVSFNFGLSANCFTFVTWRGFCDSRPSRHCLPPAQVNTVINNTTIVNNIVSGNNNTIVNQGISPDRVAEHAGRSIRRTTVHDARRRHQASLLAENQNRASQALNDRRGHRMLSRTRGEIANNSTANVGGLASSVPATAQPPSQPAVSSQTSSTPPAGQPNAGSRNLRDNETPRRGPSEGHDRGNRSLIVRGSDSTDQPAQQSPAQKAPPGSLIVIGKRENTQTRVHGRFPTPAAQNALAYNQGQMPAPQIDVQQPAASVPRSPAPNRPWSAPAPVQAQRQEDSRSNHRVENRFENRHSGPAVMNRPSAPTHTQPVAHQPVTRSHNPTPAPQPAQAAPSVERVEAPAAQSPGRQTESSARSSNSGSSGRGGSSRSDQGGRQR